MDVEASIAAVKELLEADARIAAAIVFGSAASGRTRPGSDLDVGLVARSLPDAEALQAEHLELVGRLSTAAHRDVQLVVLDRADAVLGHQVFSTGRTLFERDGARRADVLERILTEYFDAEYHRRLRREALESRRQARRG